MEQEPFTSSGMPATFNTTGMPSANSQRRAVAERSLAEINEELHVQTGGLGLINDNLDSIEMLSDAMRSSSLLEYFDDTPTVLGKIADTISEFAENFSNYFGFLTDNSLQEEENRRELIELMRRQNERGDADPVPPPLPPPEARGFFSKLLSFLGLGTFATGLIGILTSFSRLNKIIAVIKGFELVKLVNFLEKIPLIGKPLVAKLSPLIRFIETSGKYIGKLGIFAKTGSKFLPIIGQVILVITGIIDAVKGALDGYKTGGVAGAIKGAITGFFVGLVGSVLDLLKDLASWTAKQLGLDGVSEWLDSFSFSAIVKDTVDFVIALVETIGGVVAGIGQWVAYVAAPLVDKLKIFASDFMAVTGEVLSYVGNIFGTVKDILWAGLKVLGVDKVVEDNLVTPIGQLFDWIGVFFMDMFTAAKESIKTAFSGVDTLKDFYATILKGILPDPRDYTDKASPMYYVSRAIPKSVYDYAGIDLVGESPQQSLEKAAMNSISAGNRGGDLTSYRRTLMSDSDYAALPREEKMKIADQFKNRSLSDELKEIEKVPKLQPMPSNAGNTLATAGAGVGSTQPVIINNMGGNVTNTNTSQVNNNSSPFEPIFAGSSMGFASF
jgi:hypothetical protein